MPGCFCVEKHPQNHQGTRENIYENPNCDVGFSEMNNISPFRPYNNPLINLMDIIDRRMDAAENILGKVEEEQLELERERLESLFRKRPVAEQPLLIERKF